MAKDKTEDNTNEDKAPQDNHLRVPRSASFYDFMTDNAKDKHKKAFICDGPTCTLAGTQPFVRQQLELFFAPQDIGQITCMGRCSRNSSFRLNGIIYCDTDINKLAELVDSPAK